MCDQFVTSTRAGDSIVRGADSQRCTWFIVEVCPTIYIYQKTCITQVSPQKMVCHDWNCVKVRSGQIFCPRNSRYDLEKCVHPDLRCYIKKKWNGHTRGLHDMNSNQQCLFGNNRGAGLVYHIILYLLSNRLNKNLYQSTNQWEQDIYHSNGRSCFQVHFCPGESWFVSSSSQAFLVNCQFNVCG